jgi:phosphatidylethanolamine/phosphatidyl-N-methylethanolamine N-methyltransferase
MWLRWQAEAPQLNEQIDYSANRVVTYVNQFGHRWVESFFGPEQRFESVLEVGAGNGEHLRYVRHDFGRYVVTELSSERLDDARRRHGGDDRLVFQVEDATDLSFGDDSFDRLISINNLEHLPSPHVALKQWRRVVRPGGTISLAIPTEGGIAWNLGRALTTRRYFKKLGFDLDYLIAREHINACYRLVSFIDAYFPTKTVVWFPLRIPTPHVNLIYACNIVNDK